MKLLIIVAAVSSVPLTACNEAPPSNNVVVSSTVSEKPAAKPEISPATSKSPEYPKDTRDTVAPQPEVTVFKGLKSGKLHCLFSGENEIVIDWALNDGDGIVKINGKTVSGTVTAEWAPASNTIVTYISDVVTVVDGEPVLLTIDDAGEMTNYNEQSKNTIDDGVCERI